MGNLFAGILSIINNGSPQKYTESLFKLLIKVEKFFPEIDITLKHLILKLKTVVEKWNLCRNAVN